MRSGPAGDDHLAEGH